MKQGNKSSIIFISGNLTVTFIPISYHITILISHYHQSHKADTRNITYYLVRCNWTKILKQGSTSDGDVHSYFLSYHHSPGIFIIELKSDLGLPSIAGQAGHDGGEY